MIGEPTYTASEMMPRIPIIVSIHYALLSAMFNLLHSILNQELFEKHLCNPRISKEMVPRALDYINNYHLKSEVSITLRCRLCSTRYTAVQSRTV